MFQKYYVQIQSTHHKRVSKKYPDDQLVLPSVHTMDNCTVNQTPVQTMCENSLEF